MEILAEQQLRANVERAVARLTGAPVGASIPPPLEPSLETLYTLGADDRQCLQALSTFLASLAGRNIVLDAWFGLVRLALADASHYLDVLSSMNAAVAACPRWTKFLVGAEAARLVWAMAGAGPAWSCLARIGPTSALGALRPLDDLQRESPMLVSSVCTTLALSAVNGAWTSHCELEVLATPLWAVGHPANIRVMLVLADALIARGHYVDALRRLRTLEAGTRGDLRLHWLCSELHAMVALGRGQTQRARVLVASLREAQRAPPDVSQPLPPSERHRLAARVAQLIATTPELAELDGIDADTVVPSSEDLAAAATNPLQALLEREQQARGRKAPEKRVRALLGVMMDAEQLFRTDESKLEPSQSVQLRLLWCRIVVDVAYFESFDTCEDVLRAIVDETRYLGLAPLEMLAWDQRAILCSRRNPADWKGAVLASSAAGRLALDLLNRNVGDDGDQLERSLLERLLPVLDRVIELYAEGATRAAALCLELLRDPIGPIDSELLIEDSPRGSWLRFGRILQHYTEQSQALALAEARRSYDDGRIPAGRLAFQPEEPHGAIVDQLRSDLRPGDGVLQYLVVSRYVLVFAYGRGFFDWAVATVDEGEPAERALDQLLDELRPWTQGHEAASLTPAVRRLHGLLLPDKIVAALDAGGVRHLRVVPHSALYRVPFGRLSAGSVSLLRRFSLSLHPTGKLAAASACTPAPAVTRRSRLGHVVGPEIPDGGETSSHTQVPASGPSLLVACAEDEARALRTGVGTIVSIAEVTVIDGTRLKLAEITSRLNDFALLHFSCHGREGSRLGPSARLVIGERSDDGLTTGAIAKLQLDHCSLVVLQSCSTGWMDHKRTNPIQGIPQAFCDAGARACVAPLTKVPAALVATFSEVYYRALRFLPSEVALARTLDVLRRHGHVLVAKIPEARAALAQHGPTMDVFEYRYTGATGIVFGSRLSRLVGRLAFWWFNQRLVWAGER